MNRKTISIIALLFLVMSIVLGSGCTMEEIGIPTDDEGRPIITIEGLDLSELILNSTGDITAVGDVESGAAFTADGVSGTSLWFYDEDGRGALTIANLTGARTYTLPNASGYVVVDNNACYNLEGTGLSIATGTLNWAGIAGEGIDISGATISCEDATTSNKGVASFDSDDFTLTSGHVSIQRERNFLLSAAGMWPSTTSGCSSNTLVEYGTNDVNLYHLDFSNTADEYCEVTAVMPGDYNSGTITAQFVWTASAGTSDDTAVWGLQGRCYANDEAIDQAWGTAQYVADDWIANGDVHISSTTSAVTMAGTPGPGELAQFRIAYDGDNSETLGEDMEADARLLYVIITYTGK